MKILLTAVLLMITATAVPAPLVREEIRGDKKICYYSDGFYAVVSAYSSCPFHD